MIVVAQPLGDGERVTKLDVPNQGIVPLTPLESLPDAEAIFQGREVIGGVYVTGGGDVNGEGGWTPAQVAFLDRALGLDLPFLATGVGFFLLNRLFGGGPPDASTPLPGNGAAEPQRERRNIYVSPGSKTAAILGMGGFFRVSGLDAGAAVLPDARRSPRLLASAYAVGDGSVEGLESPEHSWVVGFRTDLLREIRTSKSLGPLCLAFHERCQDRAAAAA